MVKYTLKELKDDCDLMNNSFLRNTPYSVLLRRAGRGHSIELRSYSNTKVYCKNLTIDEVAVQLDPLFASLCALIRTNTLDVDFLNLTAELEEK